MCSTPLDVGWKFPGVHKKTGDSSQLFTKRLQIYHLPCISFYALPFQIISKGVNETSSLALTLVLLW